MKVEWMSSDVYGKKRRRSLVHIAGDDGFTLCGVPIPSHYYNADHEPHELTCYRCHNIYTRRAAAEIQEAIDWASQLLHRQSSRT